MELKPGDMHVLILYLFVLYHRLIPIAVYLAYVLTPFIKTTMLIPSTEVSWIARNESKYCTRWANNLHQLPPTSQSSSKIKWNMSLQLCFWPLWFFFCSQLYFIPACLDRFLLWHCEYTTVSFHTLFKLKDFLCIHFNLQCFIWHHFFDYYFILLYLM